MTFSDTVMMELGITQSNDTHNKRLLIRTSHVCQRLRAAGRNQQVEEYKHTHTDANQFSSIFLVPNSGSSFSG